MRAAAVFAVLAACSPGKPGSILRFAPCQLGTPGIATRLEAECAKLPVFENRADMKGRSIELSVARLRAQSGDLRGDPVLFIPGGPGQSAVSGYLGAALAFAGVNEQRDIYVVDPRGTGASAPLSCPSYDPSKDPDAFGGDSAAVEKRVFACLGALNADPRHYHTENEVGDFEDLRRALGVERWNLYGASYGTRVALTYLKLYPSALRSVVVDGVVAQDLAIGSDQARTGERALELALGRCLKEAECRQRFGRLRQELFAVRDRLAKAPAMVTVLHPRTAERTTFALTKDRLEQTVGLALYSAESLAPLPLAIDDAHAGHFEPLAALALALSQGLSGINLWLHYSVMCREDVPFFGGTPAPTPFFGLGIADHLERVCAKWRVAWPQAAVAPTFKEPVASALPVLLLSGEADPVTPPEFAERALASLSNAVHLIVPGQGHIALLCSCASWLVAEFFDRADPRALDPKCLERSAPLPLFVAPSGP